MRGDKSSALPMKTTKIADMVFKENSDKKLAKFQPNGFRDCRLGVKNKYSTFRNFCFEKKKKNNKN